MTSPLSNFTIWRSTPEATFVRAEHHEALHSRLVVVQEVKSTLRGGFYVPHNPFNPRFAAALLCGVHDDLDDQRPMMRAQ
mmetsp:Transcript_4666/g.6907  ORF Transcript_4666/g.6907 Transcript_4666/m.6907 type:complete len:80 (-) Transcript_4666:429-668(-)